ncbi:MAG: hypothetical protein ACYC0L_03045 [Thermoleophilia bacterium]
MARRKRDYKAEYARRIARGKARGLSRSQARGHPRHHEPYTTAIIKTRPWDPELEEGLKRIREGESLTAAARRMHVAPERLRSYLVRTGVARKERARWRVGPDARQREMLIYTGGRELIVILPDYSSAQLAGRYMAAVGQFLDSNDPADLKEFVGQGVSDADGQFHPFEIRENVLYRLSETQTESFQDVYKIVA